MKKILLKLLDKAGYKIRRKRKWMDIQFMIENYEINTIFDIGANKGQFVKQIRKFNKNILIHSFEPVNEPFQELKKLSQKDDNLHCHNFALGDLETKSIININNTSDSSSLLNLGDIHKENYPKSFVIGKQKIKIKRLDDLFHPEKLKNNILVKLDVQGFEDKVIEGAAKIIKNVKVIICEVSFQEMYQDQTSFIDIYSILLKKGFSYYGNLHDHYDKVNGKIMFADAVFISNVI